MTFILLLFSFHLPKNAGKEEGFFAKMKHLDILGFFLFAPAVVMLLLALQWGGQKYPWNSATIIGLFCGFGACIMTFAAWQWHQKDKASIPPSIMLNRTVLLTTTISWFTFGGIQLIAYYLPTWFQVINDVDPTTSGVFTLPQVLASVICSLLSGVLGKPYSLVIFAGPLLTVDHLVTKIGFYNPFFLVGLPLLAISGGLFTTLKVDTPRSMVIGFQIMTGAGTGLALQMVRGKWNESLFFELMLAASCCSASSSSCIENSIRHVRPHGIPIPWWSNSSGHCTESLQRTPH